MVKCVSNFKATKENILSFGDKLDDSEELQERLGYVRAWYAVQDDKRNWHFGPSKFIGYQGMTADIYISNYDLDGKVTEKVLQEWFVTIDRTHPLYDELNEELIDYLDWYEKTPSAAARINIPLEAFNQKSGRNSEHDRNVCDLLIAIANDLPPTEVRRLKSAI